MKLRERTKTGDRAMTKDRHKPDAEQVYRTIIEESVLKAVLPHEPTRRAFLATVGRSTALAAIASMVPFPTLQALAQEKGALERKDLKVGFISISCATPLIMAHPLG